MALCDANLDMQAAKIAAIDNSKSAYQSSYYGGTGSHISYFRQYVEPFELSVSHYSSRFLYQISYIQESSKWLFNDAICDACYYGLIYVS